MAKLTLSDLPNLDNPVSAVGTINANNTATEVALENTLSRDGTSPNAMGATLDMNSNRIINLPVPLNSTEPVTFGMFNAAVLHSGNIPTGGTTGQVLSKTSATDYAMAWADPTGGGGSTVSAGTNISLAGTSPVVISTTLTPTFTTVNKLTLTAPATGATLTILDGTTLTGPAATGTLVSRTSTDTLTNKSISGATNTLSAIPLVALNTQGAFSFVVNNTSGSAAPTAVDIASLTSKATPAGTDYVLLSDQAASGALKKALVSSISAGGSVSSINGATGALTLTIPPYGLVPSGRLSYSNTSAVTTSDLATTSAATIYYVDIGGGFIPIWNTGTGKWTLYPFTGSLSLALDSNSGHTMYHAANSTFDVYAFYDSGLGSIRLGTASSAGNDFASRGVGCSDVALKNGIWVNSVDTFLRINNTGNVNGTDYIVPGANQATYLGSISTVAAGQGEDSNAKRLVYNAYNTQPRFGYKKFTGTGYAYSTSTYRQVNADATMQVEMLLGLPGVLVDLHSQHYAQSAAFPAAIYTCVANGAGTEYTPSFGNYGRIIDTTGGWQCTFDAAVYPGIGRQIFIWQEKGAGASTQNWQTDSDTFRNGITVRAVI